MIKYIIYTTTNEHPRTINTPKNGRVNYTAYKCETYESLVTTACHLANTGVRFTVEGVYTKAPKPPKWVQWEYLATGRLYYAPDTWNDSRMVAEFGGIAEEWHRVEE